MWRDTRQATSRWAFDWSGEGTLQIKDTHKPEQVYAFSFNHCTNPEPRKRKLNNLPARWKSNRRIVVLFPSDDGQGDECELDLKPRYAPLRTP